VRSHLISHQYGGMLHRFLAAALTLGCSALVIHGHPVPDLPVRAWFESGGAAVIRVEVDPRCFEEDPEQTPYFLNAVFTELDAKARDEMKARARELIRRSVEFRFEPLGRSDPEFHHPCGGAADEAGRPGDDHW
jgi:hypothetical protein